jgi:hypothetical protein
VLYSIQVSRFSRYIVGLYSILGTVIFSTTFSLLTHNAPAAWRSGGFH